MCRSSIRGSCLAERRTHRLAQCRQSLPREPGIASFPSRGAPGRMWQGKPVRQEVTIGADPTRHRAGPQRIDLSIGTDQQGQADGRQPTQQTLPPQGRAFRAGWAIAALCIAPRIAKPHRHDGNTGCVVEKVPIDPQPATQPIARGIVERNPRFMDLRPGCLAGDQYPRRHRCLKHRPRPQWQVFGADPAGPDLRRYRVERLVR